jgi:hypothetical protein
MHKATQIVAIALALAASYLAGTMQAPARAEDDSSKMVGLLRDIARAEAAQAEALKTIARSSEKCAH